MAANPPSRAMHPLAPPPGITTKIALMATAVACASCGSLTAQTAPPVNPISRIARIFSPNLTRVEDRVSWLDSQLSSYAVKCDLPLKYEIGYRGGRHSASEAPPAVTLDLGKVRKLENIFLVPSQKEFTGDLGIFPRRFLIEVSSDPSFRERDVIFNSGPTPFVHTSSGPVRFTTDKAARYVRLTVKEGHNKGTLEVFGLSEFLATSGGEPVSFGCPVATTGNLGVPGMWTPEALTDSRMPLGSWQHGGHPNPIPGDLVFPSRNEAPVTWSANWEKPAELDRIVIHPYQMDRTYESLVMPEEITITLTTADGPRSILWRNPLPGGSSTTPLVIPLHGQRTSGIQVAATKPLQVGGQLVSALSEIEIWSGNWNVLHGMPLARVRDGVETTVTSLTNGYNSSHYIIPVSSWLSQLCEREKIENELASLRPIQSSIASSSELNASWGAAVVLGLTFLIPVFVVERRLMSRRQLDVIRKRIASDLHDDIGSNLGSISLIARTARKDLVRMHGPEAIAHDLGEMESIARESSLAMRDIVWLLERSQDSIGDLVQRMRETATRLLREMECELDCQSTRTAARLSLDAKRHLFLFYKEGIHNILKHSRATAVSVRLWDVDDKIAMEIKDNGVGLPTDENGVFHGMNKLKDRARVLEGHLSIQTARNEGTTILLLVKRSLLTANPANP